MPSDDAFEREREANIARNKALIATLELQDNTFLPPKKLKPQKAKPTKLVKRKADNVDENDDDKPTTKVAVVAGGETGGPRRSGRNVGKRVDYAGDGDKLVVDAAPRLVSEAAREAEREGEPRNNLQRKYDP